MPHLFRFFVGRDAPDSGAFQLPEEAAHHAVRVARLRPGDALVLFDGTGRILEARLERTDKRAAWVRIEGARHLPPPEPRLLLLQAWLHRDKPIEELIRRGTEAGVHAFHFFRAERSEKAPRVEDKWNRLAVETCKQCGRPWLPGFAAHDSLERALDATDGALWIASMDDSPTPLTALPRHGAIRLLVGPEGGFTENERALAMARGAVAASLGGTVFRAESAAANFALLCAYELGRMGPRPAPAEGAN